MAKESLTITGLKNVLTKLKTIMDQNYTNLENSINLNLSNKVDVVAGKDLVSTSEIDKLALLTVDSNGVISVDNLPKSAITECIVVPSYTAMYALTKDDVQKGDTVKVAPTDGSTIKMYLVVDDTQLNVAAGYEEYTASVDWASITNIPDKVKTPTSLDIQINGTSIATYNGRESSTIVANIDTSNFTVDAIEEDDVDAVFEQVFGPIF